MPGAGGIELFGQFQFGTASSGTEPLFGKAAERGAEVDQRGLVQVEDVGIQVKTVALGNGQAVQVGHAKDKRTRPVGQSAGSGAEGFPGLEETDVDLRGHGIAKHCAKRAADDIGALAHWEMNLVQGAEMESETVELECSQCGQRLQRDSCCIMVRHLTLVFRFVHSSRGGLRESIPQSPLFVVGRVAGSVQISNTLRRNIGR